MGGDTREEIKDDITKQQPLINFQYYTPPQTDLFPPQTTDNSVFYAREESTPADFKAPIKINKIINISGLNENAKLFNTIFEGDESLFSLDASVESVADRRNHFQVIRTVIFDNIDGKDVNIRDPEPENPENVYLFSKIRDPEINPFHNKKKTDNIYLSMAPEYLIYRSYYPIKSDKSMSPWPEGQVSLNLKFYLLREDVFLDFRNIAHRQWQEIYFYDIAFKLVSNLVTPCFLMMYGFFVCTSSNIDFEGLEAAKRRDFTALAISEGKKTNCKTLIVITESPTCSFVSWCSTEYEEITATLKKMTNPGARRESEWNSILFMFIFSIYAIRKEGVDFDFDITKNLFVKKLKTKVVPSAESVIWKFTCEGIEFFIPNTGSIPIIDVSYYTDIHLKKNKKVKDYISINRLNLMETEGCNNFPGFFLSKVETMEDKPLNTENDLLDILLNGFAHFLHPKLGTILGPKEARSSIRGTPTKNNCMVLAEIKKDVFECCILKNDYILMKNGNVVKYEKSKYYNLSALTETFLSNKNPKQIILEKYEIE